MWGLWLSGDGDGGVWHGCGGGSVEEVGEIKNEPYQARSSHHNRELIKPTQSPQPLLRRRQYTVLQSLSYRQCVLAHESASE